MHCREIYNVFIGLQRVLCGNFMAVSILSYSAILAQSRFLHPETGTMMTISSDGPGYTGFLGI